MSSLVMSNLFAMPLWLGLVAFLIGWATSKFAAYVGTRSAKTDTPEHHQTIRELEAALRIARREAQEAEQKLESVSHEADTMQTSMTEIEQKLKSREDKLEKMRKAIKNETEKVTELRLELSGRAEETIRAEARARDVETRMSVMQAGADALSSDSGSDQVEDVGGSLDDWLTSLDEKSEQPKQSAAKETAVVNDQLISDC
ncbi:MAG: hypothetical protein OEU86_05565 [Gammaproteobacteria bacterium]|nr:hypothetical protein [Gammaproteobacteria bacterium]